MATRELEATVRQRGGATVIDLVGDVDATAERAIQRAYDQAIRGSSSIVLNFSRTGYINSTGIALIVGVLAQARSRAIRITACGLSDHYREIFEITRLADFMTIAEDEDRAVRGPEGSNHA